MGQKVICRKSYSLGMTEGPDAEKSNSDRACSFCTSDLWELLGGGASSVTFHGCPERSQDPQENQALCKCLLTPIAFQDLLMLGREPSRIANLTVTECLRESKPNLGRTRV